MARGVHRRPDADARRAATSEVGPARLRRLIHVLAGLAAAFVATAAPAKAADDVTLFQGPPEVTAIAPGPDGRMWFVTGSGEVGAITTAGAITMLPPLGGYAAAITAGADGRMWATELFAGKIAAIAPDGTHTEYDVSDLPNTQPRGIVAGPDGALWFTEQEYGRIGQITTSGAWRYVVPPGAQNATAPVDLTVGADGNFWVAQFNAHRIARVTPEGVTTAFAAGTFPLAVTTGADGLVWFVTLSGQIGTVTPAGVATWVDVGTPLRDVATGPDGAIWFVEATTSVSVNEARVGRVGRVARDGTITYRAVLEGQSSPGDLSSVAGSPDGGVWFTTRSGLIGRIAVARPTPPVARPVPAPAPAPAVPRSVDGVFLCYSRSQIDPGVWLFPQAIDLHALGYWRPYALESDASSTKLGGGRFALVCNLPADAKVVPGAAVDDGGNLFVDTSDADRLGFYPLARR